MYNLPNLILIIIIIIIKQSLMCKQTNKQGYGQNMGLVKLFSTTHYSILIEGLESFPFPKHVAVVPCLSQKKKIE